jgi:hypothetical protein
VLNGKIKDLDTNFTIRVYNGDSLTYETQAYSIFVQSDKPNEPDDRISSLIEFPVIKLDSGRLGLLPKVSYCKRTKLFVLMKQQV